MFVFLGVGIILSVLGDDGVLDIDVIILNEIMWYVMEDFVFVGFVKSIGIRWWFYFIFCWCFSVKCFIIWFLCLYKFKFLFIMILSFCGFFLVGFVVILIFFWYEIVLYILRLS